MAQPGPDQAVSAARLAEIREQMSLLSDYL